MSAAGVRAAEHDVESGFILFLDASNSMWGQIDGVNNIVIARDAIGKLVDDLPDGTDLGLIAYGHRRGGDCEDIEVPEDIGDLDKAALKPTINSISPKGKTPITASIDAVEKSFDNSAGEVSVVVRRYGELIDVVVSALLQDDGKRIAGGRTYRSANQAGGRTCTSANSNSAQIVSAPGAYTLRVAEVRGDERELAADIVAGETTEIVVDFDAP